jgi:hypothetical protein
MNSEFHEYRRFVMEELDILAIEQNVNNMFTGDRLFFIFDGLINIITSLRQTDIVLDAVFEVEPLPNQFANIDINNIRQRLLERVTDYLQHYSLWETNFFTSQHVIKFLCGTYYIYIDAKERFPRQV